MAKESVSNAKVEECLRRLLQRDRYKLNLPRATGKHGADIIAAKADEEWHIEVIGRKKKGFQSSWDFNTAFFGAVSRLDDGAEHCVIAVPQEFKRGFPQRVNRKRVAWERIGKAFPELEIWLVDTINREYTITSWGHWLK